MFNSEPEHRHHIMGSAASASGTGNESQMHQYTAFRGVVAVTFAASMLATATLALAQKAPQKIPDSQRILECVVDHIPETARAPDVRIETAHERDPHSKKILHVDLAIRNREGAFSARVRIIEPEALRGTAYLYHQPANADATLHYYAPDLGRTRRVEGTDSAATLFDTALSFADIRRGERALRSASISLRPQRDGDNPNRRRFIVLPAPSDTMPFGRILLDVDTERCVVVGVEALNAQRTVLRAAEVRDEDLQQTTDGYWYPRRITVQNPEVARDSVVTIPSMQVNTPLPEALFDPERFHRSD